MEKVYYGSQNGEIEEITSVKNASGKDVIYATDNEIMALILSNPGQGDLDTVRVVLGGKPILVERRAGVLEGLLNTKGYVYELDGALFNHDSNSREYEVFSEQESIKPTKKVEYENVLEELRKLAGEGKLELYEYPNRPEQIPADNSDLVDKYVFYFNNGVTTALDDLLDVYPEFAEEVKNRIVFVDHEEENNTL